MVSRVGIMVYKMPAFFKMFFPIIKSGILGLGFRVFFKKKFMEKNKIK
jgi:hypothetical protein